jgi:PAS domain S-box-containing protein
MDLESVLGVSSVGWDPELVHTLFEQLPVGVALFERSGTVRSHNPEWERIFGEAPWRAREYRFRPVDGPVDDQDSPIDQAMAGATIRGQEYECSLGDGGVRCLRLTAVPLPEKSGLDGGALVMVADVSERRSLETVRQQALGVVAHDLRNPLSALRMTTAMLARPKELTTERRVQLAERMLGTIGRMEAIVSSLLDFARSEAGVELRLRREKVDLAEVLEGIRRELEILYAGRQLELRVVGDPSGLWDRNRLERVLANLLTNAFKHGAEGGAVSVVVDGSAEETVFLRVRNQGPPIPPELLPEVFEPFTIGPLGPEGRRRNIGLGLFIVRHLVTAHGGAVSVHSTAEEGTTFTVNLPRLPAAPSVLRQD